MTGSEIVEEILHEAYRLGIADNVFKISKELQNMGMDLISSYEKAFIQVSGNIQLDFIK